MSDTVVGIIAILTGAVFCFRGYLAMRIIIPLWGSFAGFMLGAGITAGADGFLGSALGWIVGIVMAVVFGLIVVQRFLLPLVGVTADRAGLFLDFCADFFGGCILVGILLAFYRRIAGRRTHFRTEAEDIVVLLLLFGIVTTGFFLESCRLAVVDPQPRIWASFLGAAGGTVLRMWDLPWTNIRFYVWILHAVLVFVLFAYFPFSKLFHIVTSPVSIVATASEAHYKQRQ